MLAYTHFKSIPHTRGALGLFYVPYWVSIMVQFH